MLDKEPKEKINEKELIAEILDAINEGGEEKAILLLKRYQQHDTSPLMYARILMLFDKVLTEQFSGLSKSFETIENQNQDDHAPGNNAHL